jgi:hypothetical protein
MNEPSQRMNLNQRAGQELDTAHQTRPESTVTEFQTAEELLRHDAATIKVPEGIAGRLAESAQGQPPDPWWRRMFKS